MADSMKLTTVAEGVEEEGQADWLAEARCDYAQGFYWSRPVPLERAREMLAGGGRLAAARKPAAPGGLPSPRRPQVRSTSP